MGLITALVTGFVLDLMIGDPYWMPHPIRLIGNTITKGEKCIRNIFPKTPKGEFWGGVTLTLSIIILCCLVPFGILYGAYGIHSGLGWVVETFMCYQILATKALRVESMKVYDALKLQDLPLARKRVSMIVGRDTAFLDGEGIAKATIETVAENTSDGIIGPLLCLTIGGPVLGFMYKGVNTLDSMIGYKNEKYLYFGRFAAKLDDVMNYVPARLSAYLMIVASRLVGFDYKSAYQIYKRDRYNHASPNSAHTEAVCAGALQIQLAGNAYYFGKLYEKPTIGDCKRSVSVEDIKKTNDLMYMSCMLGLVVMVMFALGIQRIF